MESLPVSRAPSDNTLVGQHHLSPELEQEIKDDELAFEAYGGDDPHEPHPYHPSAPSETHFGSKLPSSLDLEESPTVTATATLVEGTGIGKKDPDLVTWDVDDPQNPQNFTFSRKIFITILISVLTINVTFASSAPSTATLAIAETFGISDELSILVTSLFLCGYIGGPILWSGLSELYGRRIVFVITMLIYTLFTLGQALAQNPQTLLVTRFFAGLFASAPLANGGGALADIWGPVGRGPAIAAFTASVFIGPIIGPIVGGFVVTSYLGWRWVFWVLIIFSGACWALTTLFLPETFSPVLLQRKARALRKADPIANAHKYAEHERSDWTLSGILRRTILRPFSMMIQEPILVLITLYLAVVYGLIYALFEVFPIVFSEVRDIPARLTGLTFIGVGIGSTIGAFIAYLQGRKFVGLVEKWRGHPPPEARLDGAMIGGPLLVVSIFWLGWTGAYKSVPWYVPELATIPLGCAIALVFISFSSYIVDTYLMYAASALAGNAMVRSAVGAAFPLFTNQMFHNLGVQWASTLIGCIAILMAPMPFIFYKYGPWIRTHSGFAPCIVR
ncbi:MFS general substrate transporter [Sistotremastrum suecicum HHB10207 ss-3]|uniref:MFS general substrate transporter n=1 Tax=Sistotremastrum suecicum HHB10207 ss-3 TaxID=1314776 RepID=A0A166D9L1_9AGAM|nr:MFS general substrate transporter [Sistotremastrum suecicum HHB10207 ss-3]